MAQIWTASQLRALHLEIYEIFNADKHRSNRSIARQLNVSIVMVRGVKRRASTGGIDAVKAYFRPKGKPSKFTEGEWLLFHALCNNPDSKFLTSNDLVRLAKTWWGIRLSAAYIQKLRNNRFIPTRFTKPRSYRANS